MFFLKMPTTENTAHATLIYAYYIVLENDFEICALYPDYMS